MFFGEDTSERIAFIFHFHIVETRIIIDLTDRCRSFLAAPLQLCVPLTPGN